MKLKKLVVAAACAAAAVIATVSLAACSGGGATLTGEYLSNNTYEYKNFATGMPPEMTYNYTTPLIRHRRLKLTATALTALP